MTKANRRDITLRERYEAAKNLGDTVYVPAHTTWIADFNGRVSSGETVVVSREGTTASDALHALEQALEEQGYTVE